jgi:hypothetical protein
LTTATSAICVEATGQMNEPFLTHCPRCHNEWTTKDTHIKPGSVLYGMFTGWCDRCRVTYTTLRGDLLLTLNKFPAPGCFIQWRRGMKSTTDGCSVSSVDIELPWLRYDVSREDIERLLVLL